MLIEHRPGHFRKGPIFAFNHAILWRNIRRVVLVIKTKATTEVIKMSILKFRAIVIANSPHGMRKLIL